MKRFIKLHTSEDAMELMRDPMAFTLLTSIAMRAKRRSVFNIDGLDVGEARVGDHKTYGMTRGQYREATKRLTKYGFITTRTTNKGTIAKLSSSAVYDINIDSDAAINVANEQPSSNHPTTTNKKDKNNKNIKKYIYPSLFEDFYEAFPKRGSESKHATLKVWEKVNDCPKEDLVVCASLYAKSKQVADGFGKMATTWLNQKVYLDLCEEAKKRAAHDAVLAEEQEKGLVRKRYEYMTEEEKARRLKGEIIYEKEKVA